MVARGRWHRHDRRRVDPGFRLGPHLASPPLARSLLFGQLSDATWDLVHRLLRKSGHFLGYGALGLVWLRAWRMTLPDARFLSQTGLALLGTALVASWDEWHQTFLPNRTGSPYDVLLDCCGAAAMIGMAWLYLRSFLHAQAAR